MGVSMNFRNGNSISIGKFLGLGFFTSFLMVYIYAKSIYVAYVLLSFTLMLFAYVNYIKNFYKIDKICRVFISLVFIVSLLNGIVYGNIKSNIMINISLLLPLSVSTLDIKLVHIKKGLISTSLFALACVALQVEFNVFGYINSNTLSFLSYMGISVAFIWFKYARNKVVPSLYLIISYIYILKTGSRNVAIVILICFVLLLLPQKFWKNAWFFRSICIVALLYTVFAMYIMEWGFDNVKIAEWLDEYVNRFSEKGWEMESRVDYLALEQYNLQSKGIVEQLFGSGILKHMGHNLFYQTAFTYGYLGTLFIYIIYYFVFEMAYRIIKRDNNMIVLGCVIIMIGHFFIQGADVYMLGAETCIVMPAIIMGLIMQQYREMCK